MINDFIEEQKIAYQIITNLVMNRKISHAYMIETNGYTKKDEFTYAFAKYILCPNHHVGEHNGFCEICDKSKDNQNNIKIVEPEGLMIKKKQMQDLQHEFSIKSINSEQKVYIINGADKLNTSSANSILKFLEEPEEGIIALLVVDNRYQVLNTILSRCQIISLKNDVNVMNQTFDQKLFHLFHEDISVDMVETVLAFAQNIEKNKLDTILYLQEIWYNKIQNRQEFLNAMELLLYLYKDVLNKKIHIPMEFFDEYEEIIDEIEEKNTENSLCEKIEFIVKMLDYIKCNGNINAIMDMLVKKFSEVVL